jgi:hypothetical protein
MVHSMSAFILSIVTSEVLKQDRRAIVHDLDSCAASLYVGLVSIKSNAIYINRKRKRSNHLFVVATERSEGRKEVCGVENGEKNASNGEHPIRVVSNYHKVHCRDLLTFHRATRTPVRSS